MPPINPVSKTSAIISLIRGPLGLTALIIGFGCFVYLALKPFTWDPPRHFNNGAKFLDNGNLEIRSEGMFYGTTPPHWLPMAAESGSITLEIKLRAFTTRPGGPDRIITLAKDQYESNFVVGQDGDSLVVRVLDPDNPNEKTRFVENRITAVLEKDAWRHLRIDINQNILKIWIDGSEVINQKLPQTKSLAHWNLNHLLAIGNEHNGRRAWLGEIAGADIIVGETRHDLLRSDQMLLPDTFWSARFSPRIDSMLKLDIDRKLIVDYTANFICFMPLGFLMAVRRGINRSVFSAILICGAASLGVEIAQVFFDECFPSIYDWLLNTGGAAAGAILGIRIIKEVH